MGNREFQKLIVFLPGCSDFLSQPGQGPEMDEAKLSRRAVIKARGIQMDLINLHVQGPVHVCGQ